MRKNKRDLCFQLAAKEARKVLETERYCLASDRDCDHCEHGCPPPVNREVALLFAQAVQERVTPVGAGGMQS